MTWTGSAEAGGGNFYRVLRHFLVWNVLSYGSMRLRAVACWQTSRVVFSFLHLRGAGFSFLCLETSLSPRSKISSLNHFEQEVRAGVTCSRSGCGLACERLTSGTSSPAPGAAGVVLSALLSVWRAGSYFSLDLITWKIIWWHCWTLLFLF